MSLDAIRSKLDKLYDRLEGKAECVTMKDGSRVTVGRHEFLGLFADAIGYARWVKTGEGDYNRGWLQSRGGMLVQNLAPGQNGLLDVAQGFIEATREDPVVRRQKTEWGCIDEEDNG